jgi:putative transposase
VTCRPAATRQCRDPNGEDDPAPYARSASWCDRTLILNQRHLLHALRQYEAFYNEHRPHQGIDNARPLALLPAPITDPDRLTHLNIHRHGFLGGILHEYENAA